jgi:hypothetical protein
MMFPRSTWITWAATVAVLGLSACQTPGTARPAFVFKALEQGPQRQREARAQALAEQVFPSGTLVSTLYANFDPQKPHVYVDADGRRGHHITFRYVIPQLSIVTTEWVVDFTLDSAGAEVRKVEVHRYLTGL